MKIHMKKLILFLSCLPLFAGEFEINLLIDGKPAHQYASGGSVYVEGKKGATFALELKNNTASRVLFVPSIDGLSALDGKSQANTHDDSGYAVGPFSSYRVEGWRTSLDTVRKFEFANKGEGKTYAEQMTGKAESCGVVSVRVIKEKPFIIQNETTWINVNDSILTINAGSVEVSNISTLVSAVNTSATLDLGTRFGDESESRVRKVDFERGEIGGDFTIYYASRSGLQAMGIKVLPVAVANNEFCPEPTAKN